MAVLAVAVGLVLPTVVRADEAITPKEVASFDHFLDQHPQIDRDLHANPGLVDDPAYMKQHPELHEYLQAHPAVRQDLRQHPQQFMKRERHLERHERHREYREHRHH